MAIAARKKKMPVGNGPGRRSVFPWKQLNKKGASFFVAGKQRGGYVYSSLLWYNKKRQREKRKPISITISTDKKGVYVWRTQ